MLVRCLDIAAAHLGELAALILHAAAILLLLLVSGCWLLARMFGRHVADRSSAPRRYLTTQLSIGVLGGVIATVMLWTLSLFLFGTTWPGTACLMIPVSWGLWRMRGSSWQAAVRGHDLSVALSIPLLTVPLALWHIGLTALEHQDQLVFCHRHGDLGAHVFRASLIHEHGLPLVNPNGAPDQPLSHTGLFVLVAGIAETTGSDHYVAAKALWLVAYTALGWMAAGLLCHRGMSTSVAWVGVGAALFWASSLHLPVSLWSGEMDHVIDPIQGPHISAGSASGVMYHNATQLWSVLVMFGGLLCLELVEDHSERFAVGLFGCSLAVVVSGWIKPLAVIYTPALLIFLCLRRTSLKLLSLTVFILATGLIIYLLPSFAASYHPGDTQRWSIGTSFGSLVRDGLKSASLIGAGLLVASAQARDMLFPTRRRDALRTSHLALIALGGSFLFAALFHESGDRAGHGNRWWGLFAAVVIYSPYVTIGCLDKSMSVARLNGLWRGLGTAILAIQIATGAIYALAYPGFGLRTRPLAFAEALQTAHDETAPQSRFLIDKQLVKFPHASDLLAFLARPALVSVASADPVVRAQRKDWVTFQQQPDQELDTSLLRQRDHAIVHTKRRHVASLLLRQGWRRVRPLPGGFLLWSAPDKSE